MSMPFATCVADPPWPYVSATAEPKMKGFATNRSTAPRRSHQYDVMSIDDIASLPVSEAVSGYLLLWTPAPFLTQGMRVIKAWGFEYATALHWLKMTSTGNVAYGPGYWYRSAVETVLVARRPGARSVRTHVRNVFQAPRAGHSAKPEWLQDHVEEHYPGPYLELFARRERKNWTCLGLECDGGDIRETLPTLVKAS